jgi:hypothetical protein
MALHDWRKQHTRILAAIRSRRVHLAVLFVAALLARLLFLVVSGSYGRVINNDAYDYNQIASSLLAGHGFAFGPGQPTAFRPFGYPFLLSALYGTAGFHVIAVHWFQAILGSLLVVPTYLIAERLAGARVAVLAGLGVACHPILIYLAALIAPETVALLLQMSGLWFALEMMERRPCRWRDALGFTATSAAAALLRPELLLVSCLVAAGFVIHVGFTSKAVRTLAGAALVATALVVLPPVFRNWLVFDAFIPFPTVGGVTFWGGNNALARGGWVLPSDQTWPDDDPPASMRGWQNLTEQESQARFYQASLRWMEKHPGDVLTLVLRKLARSWTISYADEGRPRAVPVGVELAHWMFGLLALTGMIIALRGRRPIWWLLFAAILAWLIKTVLFYGSARQTAPILPVSCVFASVTVDAAIMALHHSRKRKRKQAR